LPDLFFSAKTKEVQGPGTGSIQSDIEVFFTFAVM
jgi:hypothetical protein